MNIIVGEGQMRDPGRSTGLRGNEELEVVVTTLLGLALAASEAERGNVQLFHPRLGGLTIAAHQGFDRAFLAHFALVADDGAACGRAARTVAQVVIEDVETDPDFAPHLEIAQASGFRAVQSTPLVSPAGSLVGMVSTHYPHPHRPAPEQLELLARYGQSFGGLLADRVGDTTTSVDVLVVDDDESVRSSVAEILRNANYQVIEAPDGFAALANLAVRETAVILLDVQMPGLDGLALLGLLESPPPAIIMSANDHKARIEALGSKVGAHLTKPVAPALLLAVVGEMLGDTRADV